MSLQMSKFKYLKRVRIFHWFVDNGRVGKFTEGGKFEPFV